MHGYLFFILFPKGEIAIYIAEDLHIILNWV